MKNFNSLKEGLHSGKKVCDVCFRERLLSYVHFFGRRKSLFMLFQVNLCHLINDNKVTIWLINILVWVFSSELRRGFRGQEWKKRWKQEKWGHTKACFIKFCIPHITRGEELRGRFCRERSKGREKGPKVIWRMRQSRAKWKVRSLYQPEPWGRSARQEKGWGGKKGVFQR